MVRDWTTEELETIAAADELRIAALRPDGSLRPYTTIWVVRVGDDLCVRAYRGCDGAWFRSVLRRPEGRIQVAGLTRDVAFAEPGGADQATLGAAIDRLPLVHRSSIPDLGHPGRSATWR